MTQSVNQIVLPPPFPDHTQLPESDGTFVKNFQEHPQSLILTDSIGPILQRLHPDGQYAIGQDSGIYWQETLLGLGLSLEQIAEALGLSVDEVREIRG